MPGYYPGNNLMNYSSARSSNSSNNNNNNDTNNNDNSKSNSGNTNGNNSSNNSNISSQNALRSEDKQGPIFNDTLVVSDAMASNSRQLLYAHIYNYLLENKYYDTARQFLKDTEVPITKSNDAAMNNYARKNDQEKDADNKDIRLMLENIPKDQLLRAKMVINSPDTFLLEWWQLFYLLNDFVEGSSLETLRDIESPQYDYIYPLLPEKYPVNNVNVSNMEKATSVGSLGDFNNTLNWSAGGQNPNVQNQPVPAPASQQSPPQQQQPSHPPPLQSQHSYISQKSPQMAQQNMAIRNSMQPGGIPPSQSQQGQPTPLQGQVSPQMYTQPPLSQQRSQMFSNGPLQQIPTRINSSNLPDKNLQPSLEKQMSNISNPMSMNMASQLNMLNNLPNGINMQDPAVQQQYMAMFKSMMMKQQQYQSNNNLSQNGNNLTGEDIDPQMTGYPISSKNNSNEKDN